MALEAIIDVAEIDDLGFRVVVPEPRAHVEREALRSTRIFGIWGAALVAITVFGLVGRFLEPKSAVVASAPSTNGTAPRDSGVGWPSTGHSAFRYPAGDATTMTLRFQRVPGLDGSIARIAVSGRIEGPVGKLAVRLVSGAQTFEEVTRHFSTLAGQPPSPFGVFDVPFGVPGDTALSDLWIIARAYVDDRVVAVASAPVAPSWPEVGPDRFVIDDVVGRTLTWSQPQDGVVYPVRKAARVNGLGWQVDPYAR